MDSAVAALLTVRAGIPAAAVTLRLSDDSDAAREATGRCCAARDIRDARRVAARLGLAHHVLDLRETFERDVVAPFVDAYLAGTTPVPCMACNESVKFEDLLARALALGADAVVTGHHARLDRSGDRVRLLRAKDRAKDQSYFLHGLGQAQLRRARFPVGDLEKTEVRRLAAEAGLPVAAKPDSQEICFVPDGDVAAYVERRAQGRGIGEAGAGDIVDVSGARLGSHRGIHAFTVGQRRGLGAHGRRLHVIELRPASREVVVGEAGDLACSACAVPRFRWVAGEPPAGGSALAEVQVRHGRECVPARVADDGGGGAVVTFLRAPRAVAPGQFAVAYQGDEVLGGGAIASTVPAEASLAAG